ncbi:hypothetical protein AAF712_004619 [Marasmius tenuissimus]|uniref:Major facilitator superfamily (MFS) profile domain-containing protein n=1 Tax=Marasmius tenuissimus TaxID=585030 RepID=A0ABR3A4H7_9AGAR|nr:hypothetical protein PM082_021364 [Marasmius tenuissimus]
MLSLGQSLLRVSNPSILDALRSLTWIQSAQLFIGWFSWFCESLDYIAFILSVPNLSRAFGKSTHEITFILTVSQTLRPIGALIAGLTSDRFGRKWPMFIILIFAGATELAGGFVNTSESLLLLRCLYGIGLGGIWGLAQSTALENLPVELRGLGGSLIVQSYAMSYILGAVINMTLVQRLEAGWRLLFWFSGGMTLLGAVARLVIPESAVFLAARAREQEAIISGQEKRSHREKARTYIQMMNKELKAHWMLLIYVSLVVLGVEFISHGSLDLYPTYLQETKELHPKEADTGSIIGNCGYILGGLLSGVISQFIGRRIAMILSVLFCAAFIPLWILPNSFGALSTGAFFVQMGVGGAKSVIPIFLSEISPPAFRATFLGLVLNVAATIGSSSASIEAAIGDKLTIKVDQGGAERVLPDYATIQGIVVGAAAGLSILMLAFSPENHGAHFERHRAAYEEGVAADSHRDVLSDEEKRARPGE